LIVWRKALDLVRCANEVAKALPSEERFELAKQLRRSSRSVHANIVEGAGRRQRRDYARFLAIARGSVREVTAHLEAISVCNLLSPDLLAESERLADDVSRMLTAMLKRMDPL
jgi:four helix bundle protein